MVFFSQEKRPNSQKKVKFMNFLFRSFFLVWFAWATPDKTVTGTGAIKRGFVQLKGPGSCYRVLGFPLRGHLFPLRALRSPRRGLF